jgi:hypothetical protein
MIRDQVTIDGQVIYYAVSDWVCEFHLAGEAQHYWLHNERFLIMRPGSPPIIIYEPNKLISIPDAIRILKLKAFL